MKAVKKLSTDNHLNASADIQLIIGSHCVVGRPFMVNGPSHD